MGQDGRNPCSVEREKLGVAHLTRGHREFAMSSARHIASDPHIVGLVGQDETAGRIAFQQSIQNRGVGCIAANDTMRAEAKYVAYPSDCSYGVGLEQPRFQSLRGVAKNDVIRFGRREPGDLDRRVEQDQLFKFNLQRIKIPLAFLREAVDGKPQHALFVRVQVLDV